MQAETLNAALAGDADATAEVLKGLEDLIRAESDEDRQTARVALWASVPEFQGNGWHEFRDHARKVLAAL